MLTIIQTCCMDGFFDTLKHFYKKNNILMLSWIVNECIHDAFTNNHLNIVKYLWEHFYVGTSFDFSRISKAHLHIQEYFRKVTA